MIKFLLKGVIRDRSRSIFPIITVTVGVCLTVLVYCWVEGISEMIVSSTASFITGHVKIMTRAYYQEADQMPNDLALMDVGRLFGVVKKEFPSMVWTVRIRFGGLLDVPDENGETRAQGPVAGLAVDLLSSSSPEPRILNLAKSVVRGRMPSQAGEILISEEFAGRLGIKPGDTATLIGSTMHGSMATANFVVAGTVRFGIAALDRGAMIGDLPDIQRALDMEDAAGEILGFSSDFVYRRKPSVNVTARFNASHANADDEFSPEMVALRESSGLASELDMFSYVYAVLILIFIVPMSIVLWNAGLMGSLRRYGEIGVRMAIGEDKGHIYRSMIAESMIIGIIGSVLGTAIGLTVSYVLQAKGINIGSMLQSSSILITNTVRARVTPVSYYLGFIPGLGATFLGTSISGIGIYKRQTSQLAKEMEA